LKDEVYNSNPQREEELKENIHAEPLPPMQGISMCRETAFSTPPDL
jgi:hypothetical protein